MTGAPSWSRSESKSFESLSERSRSLCLGFHHWSVESWCLQRGHSVSSNCCLYKKHTDLDIILQVSVFWGCSLLASKCSFRPISTVSLLLSYWLFFERSISHLLWLSCNLSSHPSHRVPTLSSNPQRCLCSVFSDTISFVYPIQIVVVSDDTTTVCPHLFVFYLPSTERSPPLSSPQSLTLSSIPAVFLS